MKPLLHPDDIERRRLCDADLLSGMESLAFYVKNGPPDVVGVPQEKCADMFRSVLDEIDPSDLTPGFSDLWRKARELWLEGKTPMLEVLGEGTSTLDFTRRYGTGVALASHMHASRILRLREAMLRQKAHLDAAAEAIDDQREVLRDVS